jgi:CheY-like chemotaxis protein
MRTGRRKQVLLVDVSSRHELIQSQLVSSGYDVYFATSGEKVILFLQIETVDLVVINCVMPDMSEEELMRWILTCRPTVSVLFMKAEYRIDTHAISSEICRLLPIELGVNRE